jgi:hypothetical protein
LPRRGGALERAVQDRLQRSADSPAENDRLFRKRRYKEHLRLAAGTEEPSVHEIRGSAGERPNRALRASHLAVGPVRSDLRATATHHCGFGYARTGEMVPHHTYALKPRTGAGAAAPLELLANGAYLATQLRAGSGKIPFE